MSKRKRSRPVQFKNASENYVFIENGLSTPISSKTRVSFDTTEVDLIFKGEGSKTYKRKLLLRKQPVNCVTLGEVSFMVQMKSNFSHNAKSTKTCLLINDNYERLELLLELSSDSENRKEFFVIESPNDSPWKVISDLLSRNYTFVLKDWDRLSCGIMNILICISPEKTPIPRAKNVVEFFMQKILPVYHSDAAKKVDSIDNFFREIQLYQKKNLNLPDLKVQHEHLKPVLCSYQMRAVQWMLNREGETLQMQDTKWQADLIENFTSQCGTPVYYNVYSQVMFLQMLDFPPLPRGGILADEMGLGKTVAVIALMLNNVRDMSVSDNDEYLHPVIIDKKDKIRAVKLENSDDDYDDDPEFQLKIKNKESYLSPHEKLVHSGRMKGKALKRALDIWYQSELAGYSTASPSKICRRSRNSIKCLCGDSLSRRAEYCVQCPECDRQQHVKCVGFKGNYQYFCPVCWSKQKLVKSAATLIVSPPAIYDQWFQEIEKHVSPGAFPNGIFMYDSIKNNFIQPSVLASYDIVIATYTRLRSELNHATQNESSRKLRNEERFLKQCSPLTQVHWWRLCLDEAQMVENDCSHISQMAMLIPAVNRWSVTGTPIQKSITDIYHLINFLRISPFTDKALWNSLLYKPYIHGNKIPLCAIVSQIFWRNSKEDVSEELAIPEQKVRYHFLKFTAVEQNFYMREHATSSLEFADGLRRSKLNVTRTIDSLDKTVLTRLLKPLLNLRQACSHPLAVKGNKISTKTGSMTLTELFKYLYNKTKLECEEELRKYIAALNGMAGIYCIQEDWFNAVEYYRRVLQIAEEYKEKVHVDSLQRIHTLTNLADVLQFHGEGVPPTLRDDSLKEFATQLEDKYMEKAIGDLKSDQNLMEELSKKVAKLKGKFDTDTDIWWQRIIHTLTLENAIEEVIDKVSTELLANQTENKKTIETFLAKISSPKTMEVLLTFWLKSINDNRRKVLKHLKSLNDMPCSELVNEAVDCHLGTGQTATKKKKCELCECESVLLDYECCLFAVSRKILKEEYMKVMDGAKTKGSWKAHNAEKVLRVILNVGRNKGSEAWALKDGKNHINLLEAMKKEFKQLRAVWIGLNHQAQAWDEVNMCKLRLRLRFPGEPLPPKPTQLNMKEEKAKKIYVIEHHEVESQKLKLVGEIEVSKSEFKKKYGTLLYLDNLGKKENAKPEPCPICKTAFENEWCVLQCGHSYCIDCIRILLMRTSKPSINCPVCREITKSSNLSFIDLTGREENCDIRVVGEHSTKVEAIVRALLELKRKDDKVKVLIFSTWAVVLDVLVVALQENGISFRRMPGHNYQAQLKEFKDPKLNVTSLLLPISWGSKGLNLIEATHVFLVEPIMNPAEELQALGRVHRIGQTRETLVHRFLIRGTIEEKIFAAVSESKDKWDKKKVTLEDLKNLFDIKKDLVNASGDDAK